MSHLVCILFYRQTSVRNKTSKKEPEMSAQLVLSKSGRRFVRNAVITAVATASVLGFVNGFGASGFAANSASANASTQATQVSFKYITIEPGQSLWSLAAKHAAGADPRDWIAQVVSLNALTSAEVQPGQRIALPQ
jgi:LysM repeat protein